MLSKGFVLDCREPGNIASNWPNEGICRSCCKPGHHAGDHWALELPTYDLRICKNCHNQGHFDPDCTNGRLATIAVKTRHLAFKRESEPVCNISGHFSRQCPKADVVGENITEHYRGAHCNVVCRNCDHVRHMSRDCMGPRWSAIILVLMVTLHMSARQTDSWTACIDGTENGGYLSLVRIIFFIPSIPLWGLDLYIITKIVFDLSCSTILLTFCSIVWIFPIIFLGTIPWTAIFWAQVPAVVWIDFKF